MHGSIVAPCCTSCGTPDTTRGQDPTPLAESLAGVVKRFERGEPEQKISSPKLPRCTDCGGLLRPGVVWFGEQPEDMDRCLDALKHTEILLVVVTSGLVYPAPGFKANGGKVAVLNIDASEESEVVDWEIIGKCEETLPSLFAGSN